MNKLSIEEYIKTKTLIITVGLPRSGKSTWSRSQGYPVISYDAMRSALVGHFQEHESIPMINALLIYSIKALFLSEHDVVIFDSTSHLKSQRDKWSSIFNCKFKYFNTPPSECMERAKLTNKEYLIPKIIEMSKEFEFLDSTEIQWY